MIFRTCICDSSKNKRTNCIELFLQTQIKNQLNNKLASSLSRSLFLLFFGQHRISINGVHIEFDCFTLCQHDNSHANMCMRRTWYGLCTQSNRTAANEQHSTKKKKLDWLYNVFFFLFEERKKIHYWNKLICSYYRNRKERY